MAIEAALERGDLDEVRRQLGDPPDWPNSFDPYMHIRVLQIALGAAPAGTIRALLDAGADPNAFGQDDGFPALVDVMHHRRDDRPELRRHTDRHEVLAMLIAAGAEVDVRGLNDWTALHFAAADDDDVAARMLLEAGADPHARTRIDDFETPLEIAEQRGGAVLAIFRDWLQQRA